MKDAACLDCFLVFPPWDILRGRDVFLDSDELVFELNDSDFAHWAPNCATFSGAREIPIKGVKDPPLPLRSSSHPKGIPSEVARISKRARLRLEKDTEMADMAARDCMARHARGGWFSLEHPGRSIALDLPSWRELVSKEKVFVTRYHTCMFPGSSRRKSQVLIHNSESFHSMGRVCTGGHLCDRTGRPHHKWRPIVSGGRVTQYITGEEREYPSGFWLAFAECLKQLAEKKLIRSFVEIFSGPNAPLSNEVSKSLRGSDIPRVETTKKGREYQSKTEVQNLLGKQGSSHNLPNSESDDKLLQGINLENARLSGRQPGFGKRKQLIPDGMNNTRLHLQKAIKLKHPFDSEGGLKQIHSEALERRSSMANPIEEREKLLSHLAKLGRSKEVRDRDSELKKLGSEGAKKLGQRLNLGLMEKVQELVLMEDRAVPLHCSTGLPIVGRAVESPFFMRHEEPQKVTFDEFINTCKRRRNDAVRRTRFMANAGDPDMAKAIWEKVQHEVAEGTMGPAMSEAQLAKKYGENYNVIPSFGLKQGLNSKGLPKYRRIDDHTAGWTNLAARLQKVPMATADYIGVMLKCFAESFNNEDVLLGTADMKAAYRQVPLPTDNQGYSLTAIFNPHSEEVDVHEMFGQPFGAGHAVPNFYRLAEWFHRFIVRYFGIFGDHFFDDFWIIDTKEVVEHAQDCLLRSAEILGIVFDPDKTQKPNDRAEVLGVIFDTSQLKSDRKIRVLPKASRVKGLLDTIDSCLVADQLTPAQAASIVGKFGFLCSTMFGKVGRCASLGVRSRQYSLSSDLRIGPCLGTSLRLMGKFLVNCPPRQVSCAETMPPQILYTDASDVPERSQRFGVGGVLINTNFSPPRLQHFSWDVPPQIVQRWIPKQTFMGQLEILAGPIALSTWAGELSNRRCLHFVDNDSASACLVKGYSPRSDSCELVGVYWLEASASKVDPYIERVESKSNLADGPSRFDDTELTCMGSSVVAPTIPQSIQDSSVSSWFGL